MKPPVKRPLPVERTPSFDERPAKKRKIIVLKAPAYKLQAIQSRPPQPEKWWAKVSPSTTSSPALTPRQSSKPYLPLSSETNGSNVPRVSSSPAPSASGTIKVRKPLPDTVRKPLPDTSERKALPSASPIPERKPLPDSSARVPLPDTSRSPLPESVRNHLPDSARKLLPGTVRKPLPGKSPSIPPESTPPVEKKSLKIKLKIRPSQFPPTPGSTT
jgi:hypothetical protein